MKLCIRLFARARDLAGRDMIDVDLPEGAKVADLRAQIGTRYPALRVLLERSALAVNDEFVADTSTIPREAEIAVLPPVSGGSGSVFSG